MKKQFLTISFLGICIAVVSACSDKEIKPTPEYTKKPTFCYQLSPQEQKPSVNCIGSGGH